MKAMREQKRRKIEDADLPRIGPGTPAGEWFRRYWLVVATAAELRDVPLGLKILGEELVLFRDLRGNIGLVGLHCPHRGSSLEYGDIEERGIRCPYHGWLFDVLGQCLEQPAEPKGSTFHQRVRHLSYPVRELGGLIFAYLGLDRDNPPPLPRYSPLVDRGGQRQIEPIRAYDYNWFNFYENSADPSHICILHRHSGYGEQTWGDQFFSYRDMPSFNYLETDYGMKVVMKKPGPTPDTEYVDTMSLALPSIIQIGDTEFIHAKLDAVKFMTEGSQCEHILFLTPNDDERFTIFTVNYYTGSSPDFFAKLDQMRQKEAPQEKVREYDRRRYMPYRGNIRMEDIMTQATQGLLDEREEHLGSADRGVIMLRRIVREAIATALKGGQPKGVLAKERAGEVVDLDSFTGVRVKKERLTGRLK
jgi:phenylpropionate dioxygenase-like ring-hydroxylating dioxygenase large terminal subunit